MRHHPFPRALWIGSAGLAAWLTFAGPAPAAASPEAGTCSPSATQLCLLGSRFQVSLTWENALGQSAAGQAQAVNGDIGYFSVLDSRYVELYVRVIDGTLVNGDYWFFLGSLTDAEFTVTVTDTATATVKQYFNPLGTRANIADTNAFVGPGASEDPRAVEDSPPPAVAGTCTPDSTTHCLAGGRFETQVTWATPTPSSGPGITMPLTTHSGGFYFFSSAALDLAVKVVEACDFFQVHFGAMTNVELTLTVTDTTTDVTHTYFNPFGTSPAVGDLTAFANPSLPCAVFADGFETGDASAWSLVVGGA